MTPLLATGADLAAELLLHLMKGDLAKAKSKLVERAAILASRAAADEAAKHKFGEEPPP